MADINIDEVIKNRTKESWNLSWRLLGIIISDIKEIIWKDKKIIFKWDILNWGFLSSIFNDILDINDSYITFLWNITVNGWISSIKFNNCTFEKDVIFERMNLGNIEFNNCTIENCLKFINCFNTNVDGNISNIEIKNTEIKWTFEMKQIKYLNNLLIVWDKKINYIIFDEFDTTSGADNSRFLYKIKCDSFIFKNSSNFSDNFVIWNINIWKFIFEDVNLWKINFNWTIITTLYFENATLNDCIFNWVDFKSYELDKSWLNSNDLEYKKLKDNYRQLKHVMEKNWNITESNMFFEKEMAYHFLSWNWIKKLPNNILLFFQLILSKFWNNWLLPLLWIILFWMVLTWFLENPDYIRFNNSFNYYANVDFYNSFFTNINPFNKSLLTDKSITYIDFIQKIILVILYWHLLVALKRTTKR